MALHQPCIKTRINDKFYTVHKPCPINVYANNELLKMAIMLTGFVWGIHRE